MIKTYVREINDMEGSFLGDFLPEDLPEIIRSFERYPTYLKDTGDTVEENHDVSGQYVQTTTGVVFEIIIELYAPDEAV